MLKFGLQCVKWIDSVATFKDTNLNYTIAWRTK